MLSSAITDIAALILAISGASVSLIGAALGIGAFIRAGRIEHVATAIRHEVTALNGKTIAVLLDENETRRIQTIPPEDRTDDEEEHVAIVPPDPEASTPIAPPTA